MMWTYVGAVLAYGIDKYTHLSQNMKAFGKKDIGISAITFKLFKYSGISCYGGVCMILINSKDP